MTISTVASLLDLTSLTGELPDREIRGVYVGDLLSRVMGRLQAGDLWITIMTNRNIVAVAELGDPAAILLSEGAEPLPETLAAAKEYGVPLLSSEKSTYELCRALSSVLSAAP